MKIRFLLTPLTILILQGNLTQAQQKNAEPTNQKQQKEIRNSINLRNISTDDSGETVIEYYEDGHRHKIRVKGSKILGMDVDGKKIPEEDFSKYEATVKQILAQIEKDREQAEADRVQAGKDREQAEKDRAQADKDRKQADMDRKQADMDRKQADMDREQAEQNRELVMRQRELADQEKHQSGERREKLMLNKKQIQLEREEVELQRKQLSKDREQAAIDRRQAEKDREQAGHDREQAVRDRKQAEIDRKKAEEDRKLFDEMLTEVINDKIVENREGIKSLILDETELTVNGIKQSNTLHAKFKEKYLKKRGGRISFRNSDGFKSVSID